MCHVLFLGTACKHDERHGAFAKHGCWNTSALALGKSIIYFFLSPGHAKPSARRKGTCHSQPHIIYYLASRSPKLQGLCSRGPCRLKRSLVNGEASAIFAAPSAADGPSWMQKCKTPRAYTHAALVILPGACGQDIWVDSDNMAKPPSRKDRS